MLDLIFIAITTCGNYLLVAIAVFALYRERQKIKMLPKHEVIVLLFAFIIRTILVEGIRRMYPVPRPFVAEHFTPLIEHESNGSFPSGHAVTAFLFAGFIRLRRRPRDSMTRG